MTKLYTILLGGALSLLFFFSFQSFSTTEKGNPNAIIGIWEVSDLAFQVEIFKEKETYLGKIVWLKDSIDTKGIRILDKNNPQRNLRTQPVLGLINMTDFEYNAYDDIWDEGFLYDPTSGQTFKGSISLLDSNAIQFTGFSGFALTKVAMTWTRVKP